MSQNETPQSRTSGAIPDKGEITDPKRDQERMQPEIITIDMPDVEDIEGQENVKPLLSGELSDVTVASDDEEGVGIWDEAENETDTATNVTDQEKKDLIITSEDMPTEDDINLRNASLDNKDEDGTPLNENGSVEDVSADDLDIPGADEDDADEAIGDEDEENNDYSLGDNA